MSKSVRNDTPARHPCVVSFETFQVMRADLFDGTTHGIYLANRLNIAYYEGWLAAERAVKAALEGR